MEQLLSLWRPIEAVGGGLSILIIAALILAVAVLGTVYCGAAVVVLERFARSSTRIGWRGITGVGLSAAAAAVAARLRVPDLALASWSQWVSAWLDELRLIAPLCAVAMTLVALGVRRAERVVGLAAVVVLCAGVGLVAVGLESLLGVLGPLGVVAVVLLWHAWRAPVGARGAALSRGPGLAALLSLAACAALLPASLPPDAVGAAGGALLGVLIAGLLFGLLPLALAGFLEARGSAEWFLATRYLVAERRQVFVSLITLICIGAVAAGVWLIVTVLSVMNGFERTWREEIVGNHAHFLVRSYYGPIVAYEEVLGQIRSADGVVAATPYLEAEGLARGKTRRVAPVRLRGIEPESAPRVTRVTEKLVAGSLEGLAARSDVPDARPGVLIGKVMAEELGLVVGDPIVLISPFGGAKTPMGTSPKLMRFEVVGIFESPFLQYDELYAFTTLPAVRDFLGSGDVVGGIAVKSEDFFRSGQVAAGVVGLLGDPFYARDWKELFPQFFNALKENRSMMVMLLFMIMVVAAFVIVVTLMMMIMAKSADIAVLKTMGATDSSIERVFAIEGTLIGLSGVVLGVLGGIAVTERLPWIQSRIEEVTGVDTLPASIYQISTLPSEVDPLQVLGVCSVAMVLSLGATLLPSRHGARLDPVEGLRQD